jgi:Phage tail protein
MAVQDLSIPYYLQNLSTGDFAVFNDPTDGNYVGVLTDISGLDSPEVRESGDDLVQADGGIHGDFFYGRRPVTLSGIILNPSSTLDRAQKVGKLTRASNCMRNDSILYWTPPGGVIQFLYVRRQQPLRISGAWQKNFQLQLVAANPRIQSSTLNTVASNGGLTNLINNPSAEVNTSSWTVSGGTAALSRTNATAPYGGWSFWFTGTVTSNDGSMFSNAWAHAPGEPLSASALIRANNEFNSDRGKLVVQWDNGGNTWSLGSTAGASITGPTASFNQATLVNAIAPAGTTQARLRIQGVTSGSDSWDWYVDGIIATKTATVQNYFDGSNSYGVRWTGTAHNSSSTIDAIITVVNAGDTATQPTIDLQGMGPTSSITNVTTSEGALITTNIASGSHLILDTAAKTALLNGTNVYGSVAWGGFKWLTLVPGTNVIRVAAASTFGTLLTVNWRDAWM